MLHLYVRAPFAAFRPLMAGWYRPSAPFLTPSAIYGLVLNLAGIESRLDDGGSVLTQTRPDLPRTRLALGALRLPVVQTIYQQLHNYPVGESGRERERASWGSKFNIQPVRREYLAGIEGYVVLDGNPSLESNVRAGLHGGHPERYGIPFLGDNDFLIDVLREEPAPSPAQWYEQVGPDEPPSDVLPSRLTVWVDRNDSSRTRSALYRPTAKQAEVPAGAWTELPPV